MKPTNAPSTLQSCVSSCIGQINKLYQVIQFSQAPQNGTCKIRKNSEMHDLYEEDARPHLTLTLTWQAAVIIC